MSAPETLQSSMRRRSSCASPARACAKATSMTSPLRGKARTIRAVCSSLVPNLTRTRVAKRGIVRAAGQFKRSWFTMVDWTDDRIAALSDQDLKNLHANAKRKSAPGIVAQCEAEIEKREAAKPRKAAKPRTELKEFEHDISAQLAAVGKEMAEKYDLSEETAKANSVGVKGFRSHKLLDAKGYAKLGGHQRDGTVAVHRYISYRRGNGRLTPGGRLFEDAPNADHECLVTRPAARGESRRTLPQ